MFDAKNSFPEKIPDSSWSPVGEKQTRGNTRARPSPRRLTQMSSHTHKHCSRLPLSVLCKILSSAQNHCPCFFVVVPNRKVQIRLWSFDFLLKFYSLGFVSGFNLSQQFAVISPAQIKGAIRHEKLKRLLKPGPPCIETVHMNL